MRGIEEAEEKQKTNHNNAELVRVGIVGYGTVGRATAEILFCPRGRNSPKNWWHFYRGDPDFPQKTKGL